MISSKDNELLTRLGQGDRKAFDVIYRQYCHAVYCNALKITRDAAASEDILQEVFITLWEKRGTIDTARAVGGWLFILCYNRSVNILRKKLRESLACKELQYGVEDQAESFTGYDGQWEMLEEAMSRLSPQKRKVFELCKVQHRTYEKAAEELHISKYTVKEYLAEAIASIKKYIGQHPTQTGVVIQFFMLSSSLFQ